MLESTTSVVQALQNSNQVLFVIHEYLPLPLALWVPSMVSLLKKQRKEITVLVSQDVFGWPKRVDEVYPTDMVLALEQLRQVITVPITHKSDIVGEVSYNINEGSLEITVVPVKETLDMTQLRTITHGKTYDTVIGIGISASHPILTVLEGNQASLSRSKGYFVGTYALQSTLAERLSFIPSVTVLDFQEDLFLREVLQQMSIEKDLGPTERELVTLFVQSIVSSTHQFEYLDKEGYEYLGKVADSSMDSGRMASLYSGDFAKQNRILQQILQSAQKSSTGELLLFTVTSQQIAQLGVDVQEIVTALYYLPKYPQVKQVIVIIEESAKSHHVYMNGNIDSTKQVAIKYGFPRTERLTGGVVSEVLFEKLCRDITRVAVNEELVPEFTVSYSNTNTDFVPEKNSEVVVSAPIIAPEIIESPSIPTSPSLDEVLSNITMTSDEDSEGDSGEIYDSAPINTEELPVIAAVPATQPAVAPSHPPTGLDFAAIAKKMRESIT